VSGTGLGEQFIRHAVAHDVAARMAHKGVSLHQAAAEVVFEVLAPEDGGVIAVDRDCNLVMLFNTRGMYRAAADSGGRFEVHVLREGGEAVLGTTLPGSNS
jgi:beta-aspartyl-peptidase (threonine type)